MCAVWGSINVKNLLWRYSGFLVTFIIIFTGYSAGILLHLYKQYKSKYIFPQ